MTQFIKPFTGLLFMEYEIYDKSIFPVCLECLFGDRERMPVLAKVHHMLTI